jgi:stress response protein YsnF
MTSTVIALYDDLHVAERVVRELRDQGIPDRDISLVAHDAAGEYGRTLGQKTGTTKGRKKKDEGSAAGTGAGIGAAVGGLGGLLVGLGALAIPGIGPVVAAGPLATALSGLIGAGVGAVAGGAAGGLIGALVDMGLPEEEAERYTEGVRRGGTLVAVRVEDNDERRVRDIMNRHDPVDIDERSQQWRATGWQGYSAQAEPYNQDQIRQERERYGYGQTRTGDRDEAHMTVVEEDLKVGKRETRGDRVRVHKYVTERPVEETVNLREERVNVERRPIDRNVDPADRDAFQEKHMEFTERSEEPVVDKRARAVEEVKVTKDVHDRQETVRDTVRRTDVDVEKGGERGRTTGTGMDDFETHRTAYRGHYQTNFAQSGYQYEHYEPAYQYGYQLRNHDRYRNRDWSEVEGDVRNSWEERNPGTWERIKDAVRYAFTDTKETQRRR